MATKVANSTLYKDGRCGGWDHKGHLRALGSARWLLGVDDKDRGKGVRRVGSVEKERRRDGVE